MTGLLGLHALMALAAAPTVAQAPAAACQIADFIRWPVLSDPQLSPNGKRMAMRIAVGEGRTVLAVADTATPQNRVVIARFEDGDVRSLHWVNDKRRVFDAIDYQTPMGERFGRSLYAVDVDGSNFMFLVGRGRDFESTGHVAMRPLRWNHVFEDVYRDGSDDLLVVRHDLRHRREAGGTTMLRSYIRTRGTRELVASPPEHVADWGLDRAGVARAAVSIDLKGHARVLLCDAADAPWSEIDSYSTYDVNARSIVPRAFDADGSLVTIAPRCDEEGTLALFRYDIGRRKLADAPFVALMGDIDDTVWQRYGMPKLVGHPETDRQQFEATSPLKRAAEITRPVLLAYGGLDRRVPLPHGTKMRDALRAAGKVKVEWVEYPDEGHGFMLDANQFDFSGRVERFLARHLK